MSIAEKLDLSRTDVLDLTLRNSLLNFRNSRTRGLEIIEEIPREVFRILVLEERSMYFEAAALKQEAGLLTEGEEVPNALLPLIAEGGDGDVQGDLAEQFVDNKLQTPYQRDRLGIRLRNTYRHARLSIEEQGVNILYLALGTLNWYESKSSDIQRRAPLLLLPVELSRASLQARFKMRWTGEVIDENLSLETKLKADFNIELPELSDAEDLNVDEYFERVTNAVSSCERWAVDTGAIHLGFFSFSKLLIYRDLDPNVWPEGEHPAKHPLIASLYGSQGFRECPPEIDEEDHLDDHLEVADMHQVVDSDSSQTLAVIDVKNGRNLVIQGPPGTGKSQTITNLIAEAIAADKKILFVAEKMAALEVVKRRLDRVHIGDACLELHSHTANKRAVLNELQRTMQLGRPQISIPEEHQLLELRRKRLNEYSRAINAPIGESGYTPNKLIGMLERVRRFRFPAKWTELVIKNSASWSHQEFSRRLETVHELQGLIDGMGPPCEHLYWGSGRTYYMPTDREGLQTQVRAASEALRQCRKHYEVLRALLEPRTVLENLDVERVKILVRTAHYIIQAPNLLGVNHKSPLWITQSVEIKDISAEALEVAYILSIHDPILIPEAWESDVLECRRGISAYGNKWWRVLSGEYRRARNRLRGICRGDFPVNGDEQLALVDAILRVQRLRKKIEGFRNLLSDLVPGLEFRCESGVYQRLGKTAEWLLELRKEVVMGSVDEGIYDMLNRDLDRTKLRAAADACEASINALSDALDRVASSLEWRADRFPERSPLDGGTFSGLKSWLCRAHDHVDSLYQMCRFNALENRLENLGLGDVAKLGASWKDAGGQLDEWFARACFLAWMRSAFHERPILNEFDGGAHEQIIAHFRHLDENLFEHNQAIVAQLHWERLPRQQGGGQLGILRREFEKKRRHLSLRKLMAQAGNAIQQIKPVFMMSPLSIAKFIPPDSVRFDLVVFDEASQIRPVEAVGAILRGQQAVVVGDNKQLPPTSFFDRMASIEDDEDEGSETADLESILGMFCAQSAPERMLRWHYRSRHESLITVSNKEFYDNRLVIFPSPDKEREQVGLALEHDPKNLYERGSGARYNGDEARAVARAVMEHARNIPELTLGVAAFSLTQARRIEDELEVLRRQDRSGEHFFADHAEEPFFIKNLENVQGDERDVVLISVGYGKIESGYMPMNFGPLNKDGGERRLNVLITRARRRCVVYSNFLADDLDLRRSSARGIAALKIFLKYAETGELNVPILTGREADTPFEEAVAKELQKRGHSVNHQVGSAGFFIDLAVVDPKRPGRYLLGIECDGASYHSARSARDRDRLRQQVLEDLGWNIHRIWSTDWFRNAAHELTKVEKAIEKAASDGTKPRGGYSRITRRRAALQRAEVEVIEDDTTTVYYEKARPVVDLGAQELHEVVNENMLRYIEQVVAVESPVHMDEVVLRIANAAGLKRTGRRILKRVRWAVTRGVRKQTLVRKGDFLWRVGHDKVTFRSRENVPQGGLRQPDKIAPEEIGAALLHAVRVSHGIDEDGAIKEACRLFGFSRSGAKIVARFTDVLLDLVKNGQLERRSNQLHCVRIVGV